jgi:hypothetical protein
MLSSARRANELFDGLLEYTKLRPLREQNVADPSYAVLAVNRPAIARRELGQTTEPLSCDRAIVFPYGIPMKSGPVCAEFAVNLTTKFRF